MWADSVTESKDTRKMTDEIYGIKSVRESNKKRMIVADNMCGLTLCHEGSERV